MQFKCPPGGVKREKSNYSSSQKGKVVRIRGYCKEMKLV
jgi:hypothetical protein